MVSGIGQARDRSMRMILARLRVRSQIVISFLLKSNPDVVGKKGIKDIRDSVA